ncbi:MAG TPA: response regulator [Terriglobia bacterium]|nr:response regulator [Terriglobia bacterium]
MASILMIDDGALIISWLCEILRREDHSIEIAKSEAEALELYNEHLHDLVVADVKAPEGLEMVGELLRRTPSARILALIGGELPEPEFVLNRVSLSGYVRVLRKPFSIDSFLKTVTAQLSEA